MGGFRSSDQLAASCSEQQLLGRSDTFRCWEYFCRDREAAGGLARFSCDDANDCRGVSRTRNLLSIGLVLMLIAHLDLIPGAEIDRHGQSKPIAKCVSQ
jgi:hypothetical protein